ncbi:hypothetical protein VSVS05_04393 (plasmid) [Vibrio scophthalmi]|uniref:Uncharacterized protein n=1 Tax=Vibrio scophthalmi TaxID=45658 RepID=A0A1C7FI18_9VIBR|nr:hypothetical protein VSVS05_04393 [Vibrio scophthalmi]
MELHYCRICSTLISPNSIRCSHCGKLDPNGKLETFVLTIIAVLLISGMILLIES